jgi:hypothetical protein
MLEHEPNETIEDVKKAFEDKKFDLDDVQGVAILTFVKFEDVNTDEG